MAYVEQLLRDQLIAAIGKDRVLEGWFLQRSGAELGVL